MTKYIHAVLAVLFAAFGFAAASRSHHLRNFGVGHAAPKDLGAGHGAGTSASNLTPADQPDTDFADGDDATVRKHWAVLIAGSAGWSNYRHQADVSHAYQVLRKGGLRAAHMVVLMYDDIADNEYNPFPGKVFNRPGGPDVYSGVRIDYRGDNVTSSTFLAVLEGNASAVAGMGSGRVLASGPHDRVFVFYSDHGAPGVLGMPAGPFLYADELMGALQRKHERGGFKEAVLYIEACESGSMFEGLLPDNISIYVTTASNAFESSWGTYCPGMDPSPLPTFATCLGDLYSVAWMENAEACDLTSETLMDQFELVRNRTSNNYTYSMGSHVMQYGSVAMAREVAGDYEGMRNRGARGGVEGGWARLLGGGPSVDCQPEPEAAPSSSAHGSVAVWATWLLQQLRAAVPWLHAAPADTVAVCRSALAEGDLAVVQPHYPHNGHTAHLEQREADLAPLRHRATHGRTEQERQHAQDALAREVSRRGSLDAAALSAAQWLLQHAATGQHLAAHLEAHSPTAAQLLAAARTMAGAAHPGAGEGALLLLLQAEQPGTRLDLARELVGGSLGRPAPGLPLVDDWDCLRAMVGAWSESCGAMDQYAMRHTRLLAHLCNAGVAPGLLREALAGSGGQGGGCGLGLGPER